MKSLSFTLAAGLLATCFSGAAGAATPASADVVASEISYQLYDLNLNDGVTPWITFNQALTSNSSFVGSTGSASEDHTGFGSTAQGSAQGLALTYRTPAGSIAGAFITDLGTTPASFSASNTSFLSFTLSPSTGVKFTANATLNAQYDTSQASASATSAFARAYLNGSLSYLTPKGSLRSSVFHDEVSADQEYLVGHLFGYLQSDASVRAGEVSLDTWASARTNGVAAVPEPQTYLMMLAGLGLVGAVAVRAQRRPKLGRLAE